MDLKRPSRLLDAANERPNLVIGRRLLGEGECVWVNASEAKRRGYPAMARAGRLIRDQTTVGSGERFDRRTGVLQAFAKQVRRDAECLGALRA